MGLKIPVTNNFVIDDVFNIVLKKRKKEEKKKSKKEQKLKETSEDKEVETNSDIVKNNEEKVKAAFKEVEKIVVSVSED